MTTPRRLRGVIVVSGVLGVLVPSTAAAHHRHCQEVSTLVGEQRCSRFGGRWSLPEWVPAFSLDVGGVARRFNSEPISASDLSGPVATREAQPARVLAISAAALALSIRATFSGRFYTGPEVELGSLVAGPPKWVEAGPNGPIPSAPYFGARWILGAQTRGDALTLAVELAGGVRAFGFVTDAQAANGFEFQQRGVFEARARAAYWVLPWISIGASLGTSLIDRRDQSFGLFLAAYSRPFAGRR